MFFVNPKSKQPLYGQLVEQLRRQILLGGMKAGESLPSVRQLATELGVNPNTIQKAYRRMEEEGMIVSLPGRGSFVKEDLAQMLNNQKQEQLENVEKNLRLCRDMGLSEEMIEEIVKKVFREEEER